MNKSVIRRIAEYCDKIILILLLFCLPFQCILFGHYKYMLRKYTIYRMMDTSDYVYIG